MKFVRLPDEEIYIRPDQIQSYRYDEYNGSRDIIFWLVGGGPMLIKEKNVPWFLDLIRREKG